MHITMNADEIAECEWLQGLCHAHALADSDRHGSKFIVVTDNDGMSEDDILHVLAVHHSDAGSIIRDAAGEARIDELFDYIDRLFPGRFGEASFADRRDFADLIAAGRLNQPSDRVMQIASDLESVRRLPGSLLHVTDPTPSP
ncbi:hypothetical protein ACEUZ9_000878 [Paracoccus litorisediminis]|uniref:hypothetical protein n=1 Tax=Paracoccus litorisediminis TaxID=2006130 RepID=UPI00372FC724